MDKEPITSTGLENLKEELTFLKEKKRPKIVAAISEARSHGDLKENAEYHAAKEEQSHNEGRITEINDIIARANVIDVTKISNDGKVIFGSTVYLENLDTREQITYKIVGKDEADLQKKLIFFQSPIGRGLIGKNNGDLVEIKTPAGIKNFEIKDVKYI
jgi:transcription elongation factor GreA